MGCCTGRCFLITLCLLQLVVTIERQVFDFLGYMWVPIIGNFLQIIFVIIGFFGTYQYRPKVIILYSVWSLMWLGWNIFVICFYLELGMLHRSSTILNLGTNNKSWWLDNGIGCRINNMSWVTSSGLSQASRNIPPEQFVEGCLLQYYYVEVIHAAVQCVLSCVLSLIGFCVSCYVIYIFTEEDDSSQPVHDELEYIKMRYRSPARSSFRTAHHKKTYSTLAPSTPQNHLVTPMQTYTGDQTNIYANDSVTKDVFVSPETSWVQASPLLDSQGGRDDYRGQECNPYTSLMTTPPEVTVV
ncbi:Sodium/potassium-transporting ATPase subunit beta-1-interacting protein 3 [Lamellibrachia satsuma]|nr:Sodium/potassium-transporting ATPase subunit beta-1-interacting protein 3 [Lamellibrachia satsuma]